LPFSLSSLLLSNRNEDQEEGHQSDHRIQEQESLPSPRMPDSPLLFHHLIVRALMRSGFHPKSHEMASSLPDDVGEDANAKD
jgi:hypothetical protein